MVEFPTPTHGRKAYLMPSHKRAIAAILDCHRGQRLWLRTTADGRTGWIEDNTFNVDGKSAGCDRRPGREPGFQELYIGKTTQLRSISAIGDLVLTGRTSRR